MPETIHRGARNYARLKQTMPLLLVKVCAAHSLHHPARARTHNRFLALLRAPLSIFSPFHQLYMYQLFRSLAYIHFMGICHRDIKPQNLLLDPVSGILKLCDFGRYVFEQFRAAWLGARSGAEQSTPSARVLLSGTRR